VLEVLKASRPAKHMGYGASTQMLEVLKASRPAKHMGYGASTQKVLEVLKASRPAKHMGYGAHHALYSMPWCHAHPMLQLMSCPRLGLGRSHHHLHAGILRKLGQIVIFVLECTSGQTADSGLHQVSYLSGIL